MKLTLTKQEVLLIQKLLNTYKNELPDDGTEKHGRFCREALQENQKTSY